MPRAAHGQFSARQGECVSAIIRCAFPTPGLPQTRYHSLRARTAAAGFQSKAGIRRTWFQRIWFHRISFPRFEIQGSRLPKTADAVLCRGQLDRHRATSVAGFPLPGHRRRFPPLRRYRQELAASRRLRHHEFGRAYADAVSPARIPRLSRSSLRDLWCRQFSRGAAGAGAIRLGDLFFNC